MISDFVDRIITSSANGEASGYEEDIMVSSGCTKSCSSCPEVAYPRG